MRAPQMPRTRLPWTRLAAVLALTAIAGATAAGCGGDDDEEGRAEATKLALRLTKAGDRPRLSAPKSISAGLVRIEFTNRGDDDSSAQLVRVDGGRTAEDVGKAGEAWGENGKALPSWLHLAGGVGFTPEGATSTATQVLSPGKYIAFDLESNASAELEVTGEEEDAELPSAPGRITARDYSFTAAGLKPGRNRVVFANAGKEPHLVVGAPMKRGATLAEVREAFQEDKEPPVEEDGEIATAITDGGVRQVVDLDLRAGRYALICFVPDRKGGPPHVAKGMISEATVR